MNSRLKLRILDQQAFSKLMDPIFFQVVKLTILCEQFGMKQKNTLTLCTVYNEIPIWIAKHEADTRCIYYESCSKWAHSQLLLLTTLQCTHFPFVHSWTKVFLLGKPQCLFQLNFFLNRHNFKVGFTHGYRWDFDLNPWFRRFYLHLQIRPSSIQISVSWFHRLFCFYCYLEQ